MKYSVVDKLDLDGKENVTVMSKKSSNFLIKYSIPTDLLASIVRFLKRNMKYSGSSNKFKLCFFLRVKRNFKIKYRKSIS